MPSEKVEAVWREIKGHEDHVMRLGMVWVRVEDEQGIHGERLARLTEDGNWCLNPFDHYGFAPRLDIKLQYTPTHWKPREFSKYDLFWKRLTQASRNIV